MVLFGCADIGFGEAIVSTKLRLPFGILVMKHSRELRAVEHERRIPSLKIGPIYIIWWSRRDQNRYGYQRNRP